MISELHNTGNNRIPLLLPLSYYKQPLTEQEDQVWTMDKKEKERFEWF